MRCSAALLATLVVQRHGAHGALSCERCTRTTSLAALPDYGHAEPADYPEEALPAQFDWSNVGGRSYLVSNWNQHIPTYCGSCYAHGTLMAVNDRIKVAKGARPPDVLLARQSFLNCGPAHGFGSGCGGGEPKDIYNFMHELGLPDETCNNYVAKTDDVCDEAAMCRNCMVVEAADGRLTHECWPVQNYTRYYVSEYGRVSGEHGIKSEIFARGPITCGFSSDEAFDFEFAGGVWQARVANETDINHDVEVTGWGTTSDGVPFWQCRNSWGSYWGDNGFFKILRGENLNGIESACWFAVPDTSEEELVAEGSLTGSMYGLRQKSAAAAQQDKEFLRALEDTDWALAAVLPPPLAAVLSRPPAAAAPAAAAVQMDQQDSDDAAAIARTSAASLDGYYSSSTGDASDSSPPVLAVALVGAVGGGALVVALISLFGLRRRGYDPVPLPLVHRLSGLGG